MKPQEELSIEQILNLLKDESQPFPARELNRFSDLEGENLAAFKEIWKLLSLQRKTALLEDLELLSEGDTIYDFEQVAFIAFNEEDEKLRQLAIRNLWQTEDIAFIPHLIAALRDDASLNVRAQAAQVLGRFLYLGEIGRIEVGKHRAAEAALFEAMEKEDIDQVRQRTLESLAYSSDGRVDGLIEDAYDFGEEDWQAAALFAMGRSANPRWGPIVLECIEDPSGKLCQEAARAVGNLEIDEAIPSLLNLLHDELREVRLAAAWSLSQLGGDLAAQEIEEYLERAEDEDETDLIEDALENLSFNLELDQLNLLDFSKEDLEELTQPESPDDIDSPPSEDA